MVVMDKVKTVFQDIDKYPPIQRKSEIAELLARGEADIQAGRLVPANEVRKEIHSILDDLESKKVKLPSTMISRYHQSLNNWLKLYLGHFLKRKHFAL